MLRKCRREEATIRADILASDLSNNDSTLFWKHVSKQNNDSLKLADTVEPLSNDHPHQRPSLSYDHISCDVVGAAQHI